VLWRLHDKLALHDLPAMFAGHGIVFSYEAVRAWEANTGAGAICIVPSAVRSAKPTTEFRNFLRLRTTTVLGLLDAE